MFYTIHLLLFKNRVNRTFCHFSSRANGIELFGGKNEASDFCKTSFEVKFTPLRKFCKDRNNFLNKIF